MKRKSKRESSKLRQMRVRLGLSQQDFWKPVGVTQSGGCRYERGRAMPTSVMMLVDMRYSPHDKARLIFDRLRRAP